MKTGVELTAASLEDPRLGEMLRSEPPAARAALLRQADDLRSGAEPQRRLAAIVYSALHGDVDPATPDGQRRAAWFVQQVAWLHPASAPLVRSIAARCADAATRARATLLSAGYAQADGDLTGAARMLRGVLDVSRGSDALVETAALLQLADLAARRGDAPLALAFSARVLGARPAVPPRSACAAHRARAETFAEMRDPVRCEAELLASDALVARLPSAEARTRRADVCSTRGRSLLRRGCPELAVRHLEQALDRGTDTAPATVRRVHALLAEAQLDLRRADRAAAHVSRAMQGADLSPGETLDAAMLQARLQQAAGGAPAARRAALDVLTRIEADGRVGGGDVGRRAQLALQAAGILAAAQGDLTEPRRAWDVAGAAQAEIVERIDRDLATNPDLLGMTPGDLAAVREYRGRVAADRVAVRAAVVAFFERAARTSGPAFIGALAARRAHAAECAWCLRLRNADGDWTDGAPERPGSAGVVHSVCDDCVDCVLRG